MCTVSLCNPHRRNWCRPGATNNGAAGRRRMASNHGALRPPENQWDITLDMGKLDLATKEIIMPNQPAPNLVSWASEIDEGTIMQAARAARLPIVSGHVALMPDAHIGIGATVGSVIPTEGAIIPAAVGVDIGCGMIATETDAHRRRPARRPRRPACRGSSRRSRRRRPGPRRPRDGRRAERPRPPAHRADRRSGRRRRPAVRHARLGQPLRRGLPRRARPRLDRAALRLARHRQPARARKHIDDGQEADEGATVIGLEDPDLAYLVQGTPEFDAYIERHAVGAGLRPGQPRAR